MTASIPNLHQQQMAPSGQSLNVTDKQIAVWVTIWVKGFIKRYVNNRDKQPRPNSVKKMLIR
jgi:hypothetical protein